MSGLLTGQPAPTTDDLLRQVPPPSFRQPAMSMVDANLQLGHAMTDLMGGEDEVPGPLRSYQAGLQPHIPPAGTPWQQEVLFDRISRTDAEIQSDINSYFLQAKSYDYRLSRERMKAADYYNGRPLGDEEPGRSQIVLTTVRDTIRSTLPSLLRVFTAVENPVEFSPFVADNEQLGMLHSDMARQATIYASWALFVANPGWTILHDCLMDALTSKAGWCRWTWGEQRATRVEESNRLLLPQLQSLLAEPGITAQRVTRRPMLPNEKRAVAATPEGAAYLQAGAPAEFYSAQITRASARAWPIVETVRPEQVWIVADAEDVASARAIFHVRDKPASELIAAGLPRDKVERAASSSFNLRQSRERRRRDPASIGIQAASPGDKSMQLVRYVEGWCMIDTDGDGIAELIHVHCFGDTLELVRWDRTDEIPLSCFTCYREPGRVIGFSQADMVLDLQRTQTRVLRGILDSLGQSIFPRTVVQMGQVNIEDARQTAIGSIIRVAQQGAVTELAKPFIGQQALPVMEMLETMREQRTGITQTSQGLTSDDLQSTTPSAVAAQTGAAQDRLDMVARTLAETGLAPLYLGLLRMMARHQDRPTMLSLRGKWVPVDPRVLSLQWAVQVNVGGKGSPAERMAQLGAIAAKQEQILAPAVANGQLDTPLVGLPEYRNTLARMAELAGFADVTSYFKELPPNWTPPPPPPPQPSPDQVLANVEQQKVQSDTAQSIIKTRTDRMKILLEDDRARDEAAVNAWVQTYAASTKGGTLPVPPIEEFRLHMKAQPTQWLSAVLGPDVQPPPAMLPPGMPPPGMGPPMGPGGAPGAPPGPGMPPAGPVPALPGGGAMAAAPRRPVGALPGLSGATGAALVPPPGGAGLPGRVQSLPVALPPNATPPGATTQLDPATLLAMRRAMLQRQGDPAAAALAARAFAPPTQPGGP
jgi:hypothetical protein